MSLRVSSAEGVMTVTFDRPHAHNAMTFEMYDALYAACEEADADAGLRVLVLRGAGGKAFVAGTDIKELERFVAAEGGTAYEARVERVIDRLERVRVPVVAVVDGVAAGAGLIFAAAADACVCTERSRFGAPIARTLGNCLTVKNTARVARVVGERAAKWLLLTAALVDAQTARALGLVSLVVGAEELEEQVRSLLSRITSNAPLSLRAVKEAFRRSRTDVDADDSDLVSMCYGSRDFREGARAFIEKREPEWTGT